ncbi:MAG: Sporulation protein YpeB [Firmicutes bacterium ADurb.Bin248]|nr:MAG: Sporulation protein YpeB [Firmicutes bacterium ADurb.Bin248]HOG02037.1 germination protein YpeB [Clostridia bacterium]
MKYEKAEKAGHIITRVIVPLALVVAVVSLAFWGTQQRALADEYKNTATNMYKRAFNELCTDMNDLQTALGKLRVVTSPTQNVLLLDDIWRISGSCVSMLSQIPSSHLDVGELNLFITRVGDYAHALTKKALAGETASDEDRDQLDQLYARCGEIAKDLNDRLSVGDVPVAAITSDEFLTAVDDTYASTEDESKFPTLIYDGPFSESTQKQEARGVTGDEVDMDKARELALKLADIPSFDSEGDSNGKIPAYDFHGTYEDGREVDISITKTGGLLIWLMSSATGTASGIPDDATVEELKKAALDWLSAQGYESMKATYAQYYAGTALINFAYVENDAIVYNDLIKVWVDRETRGIVGADARNYLFSHVERDIPAPTLSKEEAEAKVSVNLDIESSELALIPVTPTKERLCYEFKGKCDGDEYIVYIDAETGEEQQIFVIINTENGQLTL